MEHPNWQCPKCSCPNYEIGQLRATGGLFAKVFDVQNRRFSTVTCERCQYTELYGAKTTALANVFDFFTN